MDNKYNDAAQQQNVAGESFEEYRKRMHPDADEDGRTIKPIKPASWLRTIFGIFMILIYVGMGVLFIINFFDWPSSWAWARCLIGVVLIVYGIFRAYRQVTGVDYQ